jgi:hypothetical protein
MRLAIKPKRVLIIGVQQNEGIGWVNPSFQHCGKKSQGKASLRSLDIRVEISIYRNPLRYRLDRLSKELE